LNNGLNITELLIKIKDWRSAGLSIVFTNGCFDLIHRGHVEYLNKAKSYGDKLILGLNSDLSLRKLKGENRPYINEEDRAYILSNLRAIDAIIVFEEETPLNLISIILPDVLVKGGDYKIEEIVGKEVVEKNGGKVVTVPFVQDKSTTNLIRKIQSIN